MQTSEAINFLKAHQPMPADCKIDETLIEAFDAVRKYFIAHPDLRCVPLFLGAFGDGMGFGVYQLCDEVFLAYSLKELTPYLVEALQSQIAATRWWAAHWAMEFATPALLPTLLALIADNAQKGNADDSRCWLVAAIWRIWHNFGDAEALKALRRLKTGHETPDIQALLDDIPL